MQLRKVFCLKWPPRSPQKAKLYTDSVRKPKAGLHMIEELSNSIIFPMEMVSRNVVFQFFPVLTGFYWLVKTGPTLC